MEGFSFLKKFVKLLADETAAIIKQYYKTDIKIESKEDETPVTIADKKSEEKMCQLIMKEFPDHGILGEEFGEFNSNAEYIWILDPIDGTKSFICGVPLFGTLIALLKNGEPILGAINHPILNEFIIGDNLSAECNGKTIKIKLNDTISETILLTTDHNNVAKYRNSAGFEKLTKMVKLYRTWGDCYGYSLLAQGYADIMIDPMMSKWDLAALIPVIKGAGGKISDFYGNDPMKGNSIVASNSLLHPKIIEILNPSSD